MALRMFSRVGFCGESSVNLVTLKPYSGDRRSSERRATSFGGYSSLGKPALSYLLMPTSNALRFPGLGIGFLARECGRKLKSARERRDTKTAAMIFFDLFISPRYLPTTGWNRSVL